MYTGIIITFILFVGVGIGKELNDINANLRMLINEISKLKGN